MATPQETHEAILKIILEHGDEFEAALERPEEIVAKYVTIALQKLCEDDQVGLLKDGSEIVAVYPNQTLFTETPRKKPFGPNAVVLIDVENVRLARDLPRHRFPGDAIRDQLTRTGYKIKAYFAAIGIKGATPDETLSQVTTLAKYGFIPIVCPIIDEKHPSPDDDMIKTLAEFCFANPEIETIIVVSGDSDYESLRYKAIDMGHAFRILTASSNISEAWLKRSDAIFLDLSPQDQEAYDFIQRRLVGFQERVLVQPETDVQECAIIFLDEIVLRIKDLRGSDSFNKFCNTIWKGLSTEWHQAFTKDLLFRVIHLLLSYTNIITTQPTYGCNGQSAWLELFNSTPENNS